MTATAPAPARTKIQVPHFVRGKLVWGEDNEYLSRDFGVPFVTPKIEYNELFVPRTEPGPAFDVPISEIIDFLVETAGQLSLEKNPYLQESLEMTLQVSALPRRIIENTFRRPGQFLTKKALEYRLERTFGSIDVLDGWVENTDPNGSVSKIRAFPPRLVHMLAGNSPSAAMTSIADAALLKAVNVFKMPSADPFTTVAVLRTMADIAPDHPVLKSISAVYWRGGDESVEGVLYRSQYFDKLVAWGGGPAIENAAKYAGPGFDLISFDPKVSMAIVGREAFESEETLREVAELAAADATIFNQDACLAARHICVEGDVEQVDRFCALLHERLGVDRDFASAVGPKPDSEIREASKECVTWSRTTACGARSTVPDSWSALPRWSTSTPISRPSTSFRSRTCAMPRPMRRWQLRRSASTRTTARPRSVITSRPRVSSGSSSSAAHCAAAWVARTTACTRCTAW